MYSNWSMLVSCLSSFNCPHNGYDYRTQITSTEAIAAGTDTVKASISYTLSNTVENLTLTGTAAISDYGNLFNNILIGNSASNTLAGGADNDSLDGGTGEDTILGGVGNDSYTVNSIRDVITEDIDSGTDTVKASISYTLGTHLEI
jgi:Ca2+-binding RTX toxin-like protein